MPKDSKKLLLVADYGKEDLAFKEVQRRLYELAEKAGEKITVDIVSVDPFNTAQTAAIVAQAAEDGKYDIVYHNTAPRKDVKKARVDNDGEGLIYARHVKGGKQTLIVGVNSGDAETVNTSALLKSEYLPDGVIHVRSDTQGSQFRSRDVFPPHVINALSGTIALGNAFQPPRPLDDAKVASATADAKTLLADAYAHQLSRHGDASERYVTVIAQRPAAQDFIAHTAERFPGAEIDVLPLKSRKNQWIEAGFAAAQLALNSEQGSKRTIVILPNELAKNQIPFNLYEAELDNGVRLQTSDLRALAFAKDRIVGHHGFTAAQLTEEARLPDGVTPAYTDGYGNVKLASTHGELLHRLGNGDGALLIGPGERGVVSASINGRDVEAFIAPGSFAVQDGEVALSRGSSGWPKEKGGAHGHHNYAEIFRRGGSAAHSLDHPQPGDPVTIKLKEIQRGHAPGSVANGNGLQAEIPETTVAKGA